MPTLAQKEATEFASVFARLYDARIEESPSEGYPLRHAYTEGVNDGWFEGWNAALELVAAEKQAQHFIPGDHPRKGLFTVSAWLYQLATKHRLEADNG